MNPLTRILSAIVLFTVTTHAQQVHTPSQVPARIDGEKGLQTIIGSIERTTTVISHAKRSGDTKVEMRGTSLWPEARGEANIERRQDHIEIKAQFYGLPLATHFGPEYLTYVIWVVTPEGCVRNLGELVANGQQTMWNISTELTAFGLIVTAEPYFAVSQPSDVVVMENTVGKRLTGREQVDARYRLLPKGTYTVSVLPSKLKRITMEPDTPLALYEARNALWIALWAGANESAAELFDKAERSLQRAEAFHASRAGESVVLTLARETVQTAERARAVAVQAQVR